MGLPRQTCYLLHFLAFHDSLLMQVTFFSTNKIGKKTFECKENLKLLTKEKKRFWLLSIATISYIIIQDKVCMIVKIKCKTKISENKHDIDSNLYIALWTLISSVNKHKSLRYKTMDQESRCPVQWRIQRI